MDAILKEARPTVGYRTANDGAFGYGDTGVTGRGVASTAGTGAER